MERTNSRTRRSAFTLIMFTVGTTRIVLCLGWCMLSLASPAAESWPEALARMPVGSQVRELNRTNCVELMLRALQLNDVVKAVVFMPAATDELYLFRRATAQLTNASPTLLDAVVALTNQTFIRA